MSPHDIYVLSSLSGFKRADVALHKLGICMKNVVLVNKSDTGSDLLTDGRKNITRILIDYIDDF